MNSPRTSGCPDPRLRRGFTLAELLVAIAVFSLLTALLTQMLGNISTTWLSGQRRVNNFTKSRTMLDILARDLQQGVFRSDLMPLLAPSSTGGSKLSFYTKRPGFTGAAANLRNVSAVQYEILATPTVSTLQRGDAAISWDDPAASVSFGDPSKMPAVTDRDTAAGVVGFEVLFLLQDGSLVSTYPDAGKQAIRAVGVTIATVDDQTFARLAAGNQIETLRAALKNATTRHRSVKADWEGFLRTGLPWQDYPKDLGTGLKIFERYIYVPASSS